MKKIFIVMMSLCLMFVLCACHEQKSVSAEEKILMVNDKLYYGTLETGPMGDSGCVEGQIISSVEKANIPIENGQSNFGCIGNSFTQDEGDGGIMVFMGDEWFWFYTKEE